MKELKNQQLFEDKNTIAWELISRYEYPYEVLPAISEYIVTLGESLPQDRYEKRGENVWIARSASVAESASITGPVIIDAEAEIRHCAFIRGNAIVGRGAVVGNSTETKSTDLREKIIIEYSALVKIVAGRMSMYLGYNVEYEDLVSYGIFGLIDAIDKFDYGKGIKFETYASLRIRGAILDQIRKMDWIPRSLRQKQKKIDAAVSKIEANTGKTASDAQIASELGISDEEYVSWQEQANLTNIISLDEFAENNGEKGLDTIRGNTFEEPEQVMEKSEMKRMLAETLETLTDNEKKVVLLYYYEEMTLKEISSIMEVSESRVSQLHTKALKKMKGQLGDIAGYIFM